MVVERGVADLELVRNVGEMEFFKPETALGRVGLPDDIGGVIAALLGEGSKWINAQRIEVSGGNFRLKVLLKIVKD